MSSSDKDCLSRSRKFGLRGVDEFIRFRAVYLGKRILPSEVQWHIGGGLTTLRDCS